MVTEQLMDLIATGLEGTQRGLPRYVCFNPHTLKVRITYNSDVIRNLEEVSSYIGLALNSELDLTRIALLIDELCCRKFGIRILTD